MIKNLNFILILITITVLAALGVVFIYGSGYYWVQSIKLAEWRQTLLYEDYVEGMNLAVGPLAVLLVVVLGLCIPKRLFSGLALLQAMGALLALTIVGAILFGPRSGLGFLMAAGIIIQMVVIGLTLAGSRRLSYEAQGFYVQIGSALLHLGLIIFLLDFILLGNSPSHLDIFWIATALIGVGMVLCFYSTELARLGKSRPQPAPEEDQ